MSRAFIFTCFQIECKDKNCLIIDDLCDGGGTFLGIRSQIQPK